MLRIDLPYGQRFLRFPYLLVWAPNRVEGHRGVRSEVVWKPQKWGITCGVTLPSTSVEPKMPRAVGPPWSAVIETLSRGRPALHARPIDIPLYSAGPRRLKLQLAHSVCDELHYRGFAGVNPRWEW